jgi:hypothetical protein
VFEVADHLSTRRQSHALQATLYGLPSIEEEPREEQVLWYRLTEGNRLPSRVASLLGLG